MNTPHKPERLIDAQRGVSIVELLVGLMIGMIGVVIMMQVLSSSEGYKRTTTGGDDAQNNAAIALYTLQRDLRQAGQGTSDYPIIGCNVTLRSGVTVSSLGPVTINHPSIPAGDADTDTLLVFHGGTHDAPEGDRIEAQATTNSYTLAGFQAASGVAPSFRANQYVLAQAATRASPCALTMETVASVADSTVTVPAGQSGRQGGALYNLGDAPRAVAYAVRGGNLTACDYMVNNCGAATVTPSAWVPVASNIASLRAQYGHDNTSTMDGIVDAYDATTPVSGCGWARARAVRMALVARNPQYDRDVVTANVPSWSGDTLSPLTLSNSAPPTGGGAAVAATDWQHYRYRVLETVVPIRNVAWLAVRTTC